MRGVVPNFVSSRYVTNKDSISDNTGSPVIFDLLRSYYNGPFDPTAKVGLLASVLGGTRTPRVPTAALQKASMIQHYGDSQGIYQVPAIKR
jgi:hypothetical protein